MVAITQSVASSVDHPRESLQVSEQFTTAQKVAFVGSVIIGVIAATMACVLSSAMPATVIAVAVFSVVLAACILSEDHGQVIVYREPEDRRYHPVPTRHYVHVVPSYPRGETRVRVRDESHVRVGGGHERFVPENRPIDPVRIIPPVRATAREEMPPVGAAVPGARVTVGSR